MCGHAKPSLITTPKAPILTSRRFFKGTLCYNKSMNITILGAGAFGMALASVLIENNHEVTFYDPLKYPDTTLENALKNSEANVLAVPSNFAPELLEKLPKEPPLIVASKGFLSLDLFKEFKDCAFLSGASFAKDLIDKKPTVLTATGKLAEALFTTPWLSIDRTRDELGVLLCGTLKNIYAIGSGYRNLEPKSAEFAEYVRLAHIETREILYMNGANRGTSDLSCGLADLIMTCASTDSRNYTFGRQLREGISGTPGMTAEGYSAAKALPNSGLKVPEHVLILRGICQLISGYDSKVEEPRG